jgi:hypothetical protein
MHIQFRRKFKTFGNYACVNQGVALSETCDRMSPGGPECVCVIVSREAVPVGGPLWVEPSSSIATFELPECGAT